MLDSPLRSKLVDLCQLLIDQQHARTIVKPYADESGYWFGGGNMVADFGGNLYLSGRYRNKGDSRTGLATGTRGLELAIFRSSDRGKSFQKIISFDKQQVSPSETPVLSIEGTALRITKGGVELFVSTEKQQVGYPPEVANYLKPETGVWSIDRIAAESIDGLKNGAIEAVVSCNRPEFIHVKDPFVYESPDGPILFFCSHPFSWTCSGTGFLRLPADSGAGIEDSESPVFDFFPRGNVWDVAMSRGTSLIDVPSIGAFSDHRIQLMFYDGGECVRDHDQHCNSVLRPRGYSCEELGGAALFIDREWNRTERLSKYEPLFVSPHGTGCSRYVDVLVRPEGMYATWQQSQPDGSQPLVLNFVPQKKIEDVLS